MAYLTQKLVVTKGRILFKTGDDNGAFVIEANNKKTNWGYQLLNNNQLILLIKDQPKLILNKKK